MSPRKRIAEPSKLSVLHLKAPNDPNGNPRRLFVVVHPQKGIVLTVDEGFAGIHSLVAVAPELRRHEPITLPIDASTYRKLLRDAVRS